MPLDTVIYVPSDTPEAMDLALRKVSGVPMIARSVMTLCEAGVEKITILLPSSHIQRIKEFLSRYKEKKLPKINYISYDEPYRVSPENIQNICSSIRDWFLLINANLLFYPSLINAITKTTNEDDKNECELITVKEGARPLPLFVLKKDLLGKLEGFCSQKPRGIESCLNYLTEVSTKKELQISDKFDTFLIAKRREIPVAEKFLSEHIRLSTNGPIARYFNKRISLPISQFLARLWISPNAVTVFNIVIGVFSGVFMADGKNYWVILFGAVLFQLASVIDGCDGELAKLTFRASKFGQYLDTISDNMTLGSLMVGLIAGYWRQTHSPVAFYLGGVMLVSVAIILYFMGQFLKHHTDSASLVTYDKEFIQKLSRKYPSIVIWFINTAKYTLKKDAYSFAVIILAAFGVLYTWLYACAFGTSVAAVFVVYLDFNERTKEYDQPEA